MLVELPVTEKESAAIVALASGNATPIKTVLKELRSRKCQWPDRTAMRADTWREAMRMASRGGSAKALDYLRMTGIALARGMSKEARRILNENA